ncbi:hypothetical protein CPB83DRAFT_847119 [Crepidotus variabilis]|uniref:Uncharacterized protein n=1 Tax=Crepidotus variabilis TaxID=179855 RepID=A0A9P6EQ47_9AGAR|nr:hypothetical protein CPB83DRAFT_847119 [Crepidotus variabilis]
MTKDRPTISEFQQQLLMSEQQRKFDKLKDSVRKLTRKAFLPNILPSLPDRQRKMNAVAAQVIELYPDLNLGEENQQRYKLLVMMIKRDFAISRCGWVSHKKTTNKKNRLGKVVKMARPQKVVKEIPEVRKRGLGTLDLTLSDNTGLAMDGRNRTVLVTPQKQKKIEANDIGPIQAVPLKIIESALAPIHNTPPSHRVRPRPISTPVAGTPTHRHLARATPTKEHLQHFLQGCEPKMNHLFDRMWHLGVRSSEDINGMQLWTEDQRRQFLQKMPPADDGSRVTELQLAALEFNFVGR